MNLLSIFNSKINIIIISSVMLLHGFCYSNFTSGISDTSVTNFAQNVSYIFADDSGLYVAIPSIGLKIYRPHPTQSIDAGSGGVVTINGFYSGFPTAVAVVGNSLIADDSGVGTGSETVTFCLRIWKNIPQSDTIASSCDVIISGFPYGYYTRNRSPQSYVKNPQCDLQSNGTKFGVACILPYTGYVYLWNSVPDTNTTANTAVGVGGYYVYWYPLHFIMTKDNRMFLRRTDSDFIASTYEFDPIPYATGSPSSMATFRDTESQIPSDYGIGGLQNDMFFLVDYVRNDTRVWVWDNPSFRSDSTTARLKIVPSSARKPLYFYNRCVYTWQTNNVYIYNNDVGLISVMPNSVTGSEINQGDSYAEIIGIDININSGECAIDSIIIKKTGTLDDSDIMGVSIWEDINKNEIIEPTIDQQKGISIVFSGGTAQITGMNLNLIYGETKSFIVCYSISPEATLGGTVGTTIENYNKIFPSSYDVVDSFATMSSQDFQISTQGAPSWTKNTFIKYTQRGKDKNYFNVIINWDKAYASTTLSYVIQYSNDKIIWTNQRTVSETETIFLDLDNRQKHYYRVIAMDEYSKQTEPSATMADETPPDWTANISIYDASATTRKSASLEWEKATDDKSLDILYLVETKKTDNWEVLDSTYESKINIEKIGDEDIFRIRAQDVSGNSTNYSREIKVIYSEYGAIEQFQTNLNENGGSLTGYDEIGKFFEIKIPEGAIAEPFSVSAIRRGEMEIEIEIKNLKGRKINALNKPAEIRIYFQESKLGIKGWKKEEIQIGYFDGINWIGIGGDLNNSENSISAKSYHLSRFGIMKKSSSSLEFLAIPGLITPNDDGINDYTVLSIKNSSQNDIAKITIYSTSGDVVWSSELTGANSTIWNGKNSQGKLCESGVYIVTGRIKEKSFSKYVTISK